MLIEGEIGYGKPDERVFRYALDHFGAVAADAMMIGDDVFADVGGAKRLGIASIWVNAAGIDLPETAAYPPDHVVRAIVDL